MTKQTPSSNTFFEEYIQPLYAKYEKNPDYIQTAENGDELFDVQKVMLNEQDVFTPIHNEKGRVYGFEIDGFSGYKFIDCRYTDDIPEIIGKSIQNYSEKDGEVTQIISYFGCNEIFLQGSEGEKEFLSKREEEN